MKKEIKDVPNIKRTVRTTGIAWLANKSSYSPRRGFHSKNYKVIFNGRDSLEIVINMKKRLMIMEEEIKELESKDKLDELADYYLDKYYEAFKELS